MGSFSHKIMNSLRVKIQNLWMKFGCDKMVVIESLSKKLQTSQFQLVKTKKKRIVHLFFLFIKNLITNIPLLFFGKKSVRGAVEQKFLTPPVVQEAFRYD